MVNNDYDRFSENTLGKLRANFMGTEFQLYDSGRSPKDAVENFTNMDVNKKKPEGDFIFSLNVRFVCVVTLFRKYHICYV